MTARTIIMTIIFFGIMGLLILGIGFESSKLQNEKLINQTNENLTIITISETSPPICNFDAGSIPIISSLIWGADCIAQHIGWLFSFAGASSTIIWLAIVIGALGTGLLYLGIRLLRGV